MSKTIQILSTIAALMLVLTSVFPVGSALLGDAVDEVVEEVEESGVTVQTSSEGAFASIEIVDGGEYAAGNAPGEIQLLVTIHQDGDLTAEDGGLNDIVVDRITIPGQKINVTGVASVMIGENTYEPSGLVDDGDCGQPDSTQFLGAAWLIASRYYHCTDDNGGFHITFGNVLALPETIDVTLEVDSETMPTTAGLHNITVELFKSGHGTDHQLGVDLQNTIRSIGTPGTLACETLPLEEVPEGVPAEALCGVAFYGQHDVQFQVSPGPQEYVQVFPESTVGIAGVDQDFWAESFDVYENYIANVTTPAQWVITPTKDGSSEGTECEGGICSAEIVGDYQVSASHDGDSDSASLEIEAAAPDSFLIDCDPDDSEDRTVATTVVCEATAWEDEFGNDAVDGTEPDFDVVDGDGQPLAPSGNTFDLPESVEDAPVTVSHVDARNTFVFDLAADVFAGFEVVCPGSAAASTTVTCTVENGRDQYGNDVPITGEPTWFAEDGDGDPIPIEEGEFTAPALEKGPVTVGATIDGVDGDPATVQLTVGELVTFELDCPDSAIVAESATCLVKDGEDSNGNPVDIEDATWTVKNSDDEEIATGEGISFAFTAPELVTDGPVTVEVSATDGDASVPASASVPLEPGPLESFEIACSPDPAIVGEESDCSVVAAVDGHNNDVDSGDAEWSAKNRFDQPISISNDGVFTAPQQAFEGPITVIAVIEGITESIEIELLGGDVDYIVIRTAPENGGNSASASRTLTADETQTFCAAGYDQHNNYAGDQQVTWTVLTSDDGPIGTVEDVESECTTFTPDKVGEGNVHADFDEGHAGFTTGVITIVPGDLAELVFIEPAVTTDADTPVSFNVEPRDQNGNLRNDQVDCAVEHGSGTIAGGCNFQPELVGEITIQASVDETEIIGVHTIEVTVGAADHIVFIDPTDTTDIASSEEFVAEVRDQHGNPRTDDEADCEIIDGPGSLDGCTFTSDELGTVTIRAFLDGIDEEHTLEVYPGPADSFDVVCDQSCTSTAGEDSSLTITALDLLGNPVSSGPNLFEGDISLVFSGPEAAPDGSAPMCAGAEIGEPASVAFTVGEATVDCTLFARQVFDLGVEDTAESLFGEVGLTVVPDEAASFEINPPQHEPRDLAVGETVDVPVTVRDQFDNRLLNGYTVFWTLVEGSTNTGTGSLSAGSTETDENGVAMVILTPSEDQGDFYRVQGANGPDPFDASLLATSGRMTVDHWFVEEGNNVQDVIDLAAAGDKILLGEGTHLGPLSISKSLVLEGIDRNTVTIDVPTEDVRGIDVNEGGGVIDGLEFRSFTLQGPGQASSSVGFGLKIFNAQNLVVKDLTIKDFGRTLLDIHAVDQGLVSDVLLDGGDSSGVGIGTTDSHNLVIEDVTTLGNNWGAIGIWNGGTFVPGGSSNIHVTGTLDLAEDVEVYTEDKGFPMDNIVIDGSPYRVDADLATTHVFYYQTIAKAQAAALLLESTDGGATIQDLDEGKFHVFDTMAIQAAVDAADPGALVEVDDGTYSENIVVDKDDLSLLAVGDAVMEQEDPNAPMLDVQADGFTLGGFTLRGFTSAAAMGGAVDVTGQNAVFQDLYVLEEEGGAWSFWVRDGADGFQILDSVFEASDRSNRVMRVDSVDDLLIQGNEFRPILGEDRIGTPWVLTDKDASIIDNVFELAWGEAIIVSQGSTDTSEQVIVIQGNTATLFDDSFPEVKISLQPASVNGETDENLMEDAITNANPGITEVELGWMGS